MKTQFSLTKYTEQFAIGAKLNRLKSIKQKFMKNWMDAKWKGATSFRFAIAVATFLTLAEPMYNWIENIKQRRYKHVHYARTHKHAYTRSDRRIRNRYTFIFSTDVCAVECLACVRTCVLRTYNRRMCEWMSGTSNSSSSSDEPCWIKSKHNTAQQNTTQHTTVRSNVIYV